MDYLSIIYLLATMNWIEYWREIGLLASPVIGWFIGRKSNAIKLKTEGAGAVEALQRIYDKYIEHNSAVTQEITNRVNQLEKHNRELQKNFNDMSLSYAVVVGESQKFEAKYNQLIKDYEQLRGDYESLKVEFEMYKEENKSE